MDNFIAEQEGRFRRFTCIYCGHVERVEWEPPIIMNTGIAPEHRAQFLLERHQCNTHIAMVGYEP